MRLTLDTDALPARDRVPFWHDAICQDIFHVTPSARIEGDFRARLDVQTVGRFTMAELQSTHGGIEKTAANLARGAGNSVMLFLAAERSHHYQRNSYEFVMAPGDVCIVPMDQRFHCVAGQVPFRSLLIPHGVLSPLMVGGELPQARLLQAASPLGALLRGSFEAAATQLPLMTEALGDAVLGHLSGLVALACAPTEAGQEAGRAGLRAARLAAVKRHIDQHLAEAGLTPARVAAALRISLRQLHGLFEPTGGSFSQYLLRRRLERCHATLASPTGAARSVADIAFGWGFSSLSVFYRAFTAAYGLSPSELRRSGPTGAVRQSPASLV